MDIYIHVLPTSYHEFVERMPRTPASRNEIASFCSGFAALPSFRDLVRCFRSLVYKQFLA